MSQYDFGTIDPFVVDGVALASMLNNWRDALYSMQRGGARPSFAVPGQAWINDSAGPSSWIVNLYVSSTIGDVPLFSVNTVSGLVTWRAGLLGGPFLPLAGGAVAGPTSFADVLSALTTLLSDSVSGTPLHRFRAQANAANSRIVELVENADGTFAIRAMSDDLTTLQGQAKINRDGSMVITAPAGGAAAGEAVTASWVRALIPALGLGTPPGLIAPYAAGGAAPSGWLLCDGSVKSRTTYAALFAVIGTGYNTGGEAGTDFRLPDLRGRAVFGADAMGGIAANRIGGAGAAAGGVSGGDPGWSGGEQSHTLVNAETPALGGAVDVNFGDAFEGYFPLLDMNTPAGTTGWGGLSITANFQPMKMQISGVGGGGMHNNMPPAIVLNYLIKT